MNALRLVLFVLLFAVAVVGGSAIAHAAEISAGEADAPGMIAAGGDSTCLADSTGAVYCWGDNQFSQLDVPADLGKVVQVAVNMRHACALGEDGTVRCWGDNQFGQLDVPADLGTASRISIGAGVTCAIAGGALRCWGSDTAGPLKPPADLGTVTDVSVGTLYISAVAGDAARCWGANSYCNRPCRASAEPRCAHRTSTCPTWRGHRPAPPGRIDVPHKPNDIPAGWHVFTRPAGSDLVAVGGFTRVRMRGSLGLRGR